MAAPATLSWHLPHFHGVLGTSKDSKYGLLVWEELLWHQFKLYAKQGFIKHGGAWGGFTSAVR